MIKRRKFSILTLHSKVWGGRLTKVMWWGAFSQTILFFFFFLIIFFCTAFFIFIYYYYFLGDEGEKVISFFSLFCLRLTKEERVSVNNSCQLVCSPTITWLYIDVSWMFPILSLFKYRGKIVFISRCAKLSHNCPLNHKYLNFGSPILN